MRVTSYDESQVTSCKVVSELGTVTVLVYNVSDTPKSLSRTVLDINPADYISSFNINALGALLCTQAVLPKMLASEGGAVSCPKGVAKKGTILYTSASAAFRATAKTAQLSGGKVGKFPHPGLSDIATRSL